MASSAQANTPAPAGYAPFAQLIKMLLPSARSVALYDTRPELVWCSDGYERPDLRAMVDPERARDAAATRGSVETTKEGLPVFVSALRGASGQPLGSVVVELGGPGVAVVQCWASLQASDRRSRPFRWATLGVDGIAHAAATAGLRVVDTHRLGDRWAAVLSEAVA